MPFPILECEKTLPLSKRKWGCRGDGGVARGTRHVENSSPAGVESSGLVRVSDLAFSSILRLAAADFPPVLFVSFLDLIRTPETALMIRSRAPTPRGCPKYHTH